jgi:hypothetical protein
MKILFMQFMGGFNHSWFHSTLILVNKFIELGHEVEIFSTDGIKYLPSHLHKNLIGYFENGKVIGRMPSNNYDCEYSYTSMKNFPHYLQHSKTSIKFGCWIFEFNSEKKGISTFPSGFSKNYKYVNKILVPSKFGMEGFLNAGVPQSYLQLMPHAISENFITGTSKYKFKENIDGKVKILLNCTQLHKRKQISATLDAYGKAFRKTDNVVLIAKVSNKTASMPFEENWSDLFKNFKSKYKNHAQVIIINDFIEDISSLYRSVDIVVSSSQEGFGLTSLEGLYSNNIVIALNYSGHLDFCNSNNSLLIDGKLEKCPPEFLYWERNNNALIFKPSIDHFVHLLRKAVSEKDALLSSFQPHIDAIKPQYTPAAITSKILDLYHSLKK